jgi:Potential Queuosine, Q, salvage protein family
MDLPDEVRAHCAAVAASALHVHLDPAALAAVEPGPAPGLDPELHYLEGTREQVAAWVFAWDTVNFGSGWFPTLRKRPGRSGSLSITLSLIEHARSRGAPWTAAELRDLTPARVADALGQDPDHELMGLYARALNDLGDWLGGRAALEAVAAAGGSAARLARQVADGMSLFADRGFYKRAQILANDLALAGVARFADLDRLTIFADNLVPHVLRVDGVLAYEPRLAARIEAGELLPAGSREEIEIRAAALHACELLARRLGVPPRVLDGWLWNRGQAPRYKTRPRHRTRTVYY